MTTHRRWRASLIAAMLCTALLAHVRPEACLAQPSPGRLISQSTDQQKEALTGVAQLQEATGIRFDCSGYKVEIKADGEAQLIQGDIFIALMPMDGDSQSAYDSGLELMRAIGKDGFKITDPLAPFNRAAGVQGVYALGTIPIQGRTAKWYLAGLSCGARSLRVAGIFDPSRMDTFNAFLATLAKR